MPEVQQSAGKVGVHWHGSALFVVTIRARLKRPHQQVHQEWQRVANPSYELNPGRLQRRDVAAQTKRQRDTNEQVPKENHSIDRILKEESPRANVWSGARAVDTDIRFGGERRLDQSEAR